VRSSELLSRKFLAMRSLKLFEDWELELLGNVAENVGGNKCNGFAKLNATCKSVTVSH
jgi:hypothetical protein